MRFTVGRLSNALHFWITDESVQKWFDQRNVFFVSGMGRSGTEFLARLLDADESAAVFHEPLPEDFEAIVRAQHSEGAATEYIEEFRKKRIYTLVKRRDVTTYGEVNSALRYHLMAISKAFQQPQLLHLARDGRDVVRSLMARRHYTPGGEDHHLLSPDPRSELGRRWPHLSRFEKICWMWADAVDRVEASTDRRALLERLVNDYDYFHERIENFLGVPVGEGTWHRAVDRPQNETSRHTIPHWTEWTRERTKRFEEICGEQMEKLGYW